MRPREQVAHIDEGMRIVVLRFVNVKAQQWRPHPIETKAFEELVVDAARRALVCALRRVRGESREMT